MKLFNKSISLFTSSALVASALVLTGCEQQFAIKKASGIEIPNAKTTDGTNGGDQGGSSGSGSATPSPSFATPTPSFVTPTPVVVMPTPSPVVPTSTPVSGNTNPAQPGSTPLPIVLPGANENTALTQETFSTGGKQVKKIDFLFVVDNSKSMSDKQRKLALGFQAFANTFFRRADLDICTRIITSDRRDGKVAKNGYKRERELPCTKPAGSEQWSDSEKQAHIDDLINEFREATNVGTKGNVTELLGKSLVTFLNGQNQWGEGAKHPSTFFRKDAVANISFLTDENNYFYDGPDMPEENNDLPYMTGVKVPGSKTGAVDNRKGIKEYLDEYFANINPGTMHTYSVTSILEMNEPSENLPGLSVNLNQLTAAVGRESKETDIEGSATDYTNVYDSIANALVLRATAYTLAHAVRGDLAVDLVRASGEHIKLDAQTQFSLHSETSLTLEPSVIPLLQDGDQLQVTYRYVVK